MRVNLEVIRRSLLITIPLWVVGAWGLWEFSKGPHGNWFLLFPLWVLIELPGVILALGLFGAGSAPTLGKLACLFLGEYLVVYWLVWRRWRKRKDVR